MFRSDPAKSGQKKAAKKLEKTLFSVSLILLTAKNMEALPDLAEDARGVLRELGIEAYEQAFDRAWKSIGPGLEPFYDSGVNPADVHRVLWSWATTLETPTALPWFGR